MAGVGKNSEARDLPPAELAGGEAAWVLWLRAGKAPCLATRITNALESLHILLRNAGVCANEIFTNQLTQKHRALSCGCASRVPRSSDTTEARRSDRARTKTHSRPPIRGLRRPVGEPDSPVLRCRKTPDATNSDSRPSEPARLASSWPTREALRASRSPVGHQRRGARHCQPRGGDNRDIRETYLKFWSRHWKGR